MLDSLSQITIYCSSLSKIVSAPKSNLTITPSLQSVFKQTLQNEHHDYSQIPVKHRTSEKTPRLHRYRAQANEI